nr:nucleotide-binding alpha-beta plait domain-containing protein [Tanacetum cinerariifolium]
MYKAPFVFVWFVYSPSRWLDSKTVDVIGVGILCMTHHAVFARLDTDIVRIGPCKIRVASKDTFLYRRREMHMHFCSKYGILVGRSFGMVEKDERVIWVEVEGVPCKWWSRSTFSRIASRWGTLLNGEELEEEGYHSNRICIRWVPDFEEDGEEGYDVNDGSHEDDMYGGVSENLKDLEGESDREEVPETNFEELPDKSIFEGNFVRQNDVHSEDPFEGDVPVEKVDNLSDKNRVNDGQEDGVCVGQHVHERMEVSNDTHESTCFGHFKKSEVPRKGVSILELIDDLVNVRQTMGYDMTRCIKNMEEII